jgi:hypothetical protein
MPPRSARLDHIEARHEREHEDDRQRRRDRERNAPPSLAERPRWKQQRREQPAEQHGDRAGVHQGRTTRRQGAPHAGHRIVTLGGQPRRDETERVQGPGQGQQHHADLQSHRRLRGCERERREEDQKRERRLRVRERPRIDPPREDRPPAERGEERGDHHRRELDRARVQLAAPEQSGERSDHNRQRQESRQLEQPRPDPAHCVNGQRARAAAAQRGAREKQPPRQPVDHEFQGGNDDEKRRQVSGAGAPHGGFHSERRIILMLSRVKALRDSGDENPEERHPTGKTLG